MAVADAAVSMMVQEDFLAHVRDIGVKLKQKLAMLADQHPSIIEGVRGEALMLGIKCRITNTDLVQAARKEHLLTVGAGDNVVRLLPPLIIDEGHLDEAIGKLDRACTALEADLAKKPAQAAGGAA